MPEFINNAFSSSPSVASVVITGLVIVFAMLLFFVILFGGFGKLMNAATNSRKTNKKASEVADVPTATAKTTHVTSTAIDDDELIAVISAAVYAMYEGSGKRPIIRTIRPATCNGKSNWAMAGVYNNIKSF